MKWRKYQSNEYMGHASIKILCTLSKMDKDQAIELEITRKLLTMCTTLKVILTDSIYQET